MGNQIEIYLSAWKLARRYPVARILMEVLCTRRSRGSWTGLGFTAHLRAPAHLLQLVGWG